MVRELKGTDTIATELGIAPGTVNSYIRDAVGKLGARDRRHAALLFASHCEAQKAARAERLPSDQSQELAPELIGGHFLGMAKPLPVQPVRPHDAFDTEAFQLNDVVRAERRFVEPSHERMDLRLLVREVLDGTRPDEMTLVKRALFTLIAAVAIGFCFFAISAGAGMLFSIADFLRRLSF